MKIGVSLPQAAHPGLDAATLREYVATIRACGLDSVWVGDHLVFPATLPRGDYPYIDGMHADAQLFPEQRWTESVVTLAATACVDDTLDRGFAVMLAAQRHPLVLARQLSALHQLLSGRLVVGVGVGWLRPEYEALGVPFDERIDRLEETLRLMAAVWTGEPIDFHGRFWSVENIVARPAPAGGTVDCWYGGNGERLLARLAPLTTGWLPYEPSTEALARGRTIATQARTEAGAAGTFTYGVVTRLPLTGTGQLATARETLSRYRDAGVEHLVVLASVGRDSAANRHRVEALGELLREPF